MIKKPLILICTLLSSASFADTPQVPAPATPQATSAPQAPPPINCSYRFPKDMKIIDQSLIKQWAEKAVMQSFDFSAENMDAALLALKPCFTDQGWQGFNNAFKKSGNFDAIKQQQLTVSSQINGTLSVQSTKDNQWKVSVPLQVMYQNKERKLVQALTVDVLISRKASGDLGIMQLIAIPVKNTGNDSPTTSS